MKIESVIRELHSRREFRIARPRIGGFRNVFARVESEGIAGSGEASPNAFYGESAESVVEKLAGVQPSLERLRLREPRDVERAWEELWELLAPSRAAQCAVDLALWDWLAQREGVSLTQLVWGRAPREIPTFCTIGLSSHEELPERIEELRGFPMIKIKSDEAASIERVRAVREKSEALLAVDANCAWNVQDLCALSTELRGLGVEFIEQPLPPGDEERLPRDCGCLPFMADESCVLAGDVEHAAASYAGFNIKLVKCGGITPALRMARRGRELGCRTMVGCMIESSVLIAAGAVIAQETDHADLDGAWLLRDDPFDGWKFHSGVLHPPSRPGMGVAPNLESGPSLPG